MRMIDAGHLGALRSQALWHGLAEAMAPDGEPVLSFCRPAEAYVCVGYHRRLDELDLPVCAALGLPVVRRQIGGGPVYLDSDQLFFQLTLPAGRAPAAVGRIYEQLLEPAAGALRALGVPASVSSTNDVVAEGRKVSGTGAGRIGNAVVVVGNVMFDFPHERMARALRLPDEEMRAECLRLMRAHVAPLPQLDERRVKAALRHSYAEALGCVGRPDTPTAQEERAIAGWERRLADPAWTAGPSLPVPVGRQVKIRAGVWVYEGGDERLRVRTTVEDGRVTGARVEAPALNGVTTAIARSILGARATPEALAVRLAAFGTDGSRVLSAMQPGLVVR
jgi:lipoate-protein ligase A